MDRVCFSGAEIKTRRGLKRRALVGGCSSGIRARDGATSESKARLNLARGTDGSSLGAACSTCACVSSEAYDLSDRQSTDASDRAVDSRVVLVRTNNGLQHFWCRTG